MLLDALHIGPGECVAMVGAGGKTTLCWLLTKELVQRGESVVFTTTTKIRQPQPGIFGLREQLLVINANVDDIRRILPMDAGRKSQFVATVASALEGAADATPVPDSPMPVFHTKLAGFPGDDVCQLRALLAKDSLARPVAFVGEADGARGLLIKAPAEHEPVIPVCATTVCVVANLEAIGRPLDESVAHRPERIGQLTGAILGQTISAQLLVDLLTHPRGGLKNIPLAARKVAVLTQRDDRAVHPDAAMMLNELVAHGYARAVVISPRAFFSEV